MDRIQHIAQRMLTGGTVFLAPQKPEGDGPYVFLAGSIDMGKAEDWQSKVTKALEDVDCVILNPRRDDWDSSWEQAISNPEFFEQVTWELDGMDRADVVALCLTKDSKAPISLLEMGLHAADGKLVVFCPDGFWRKGNVDIVCARHGIPVYEDFDKFIAAVKERIMAIEVKTASKIDRIAAKVMTSGVLDQALRNLSDLDELSNNIDEMVDTFGMHFRVAGIDPEVKTQFDLLSKAKNGLQAAKNTLQAIEGVLRAYPDDKTALRAQKDAQTMVSRFERHELDARKVVSTLSKKALPPALKKYAATVVRAIKARLVDPSILKVIPWQQSDYRGGMQYQVVIKIPAPGTRYQNGVYVLTLAESTAQPEGPGVVRGIGGHPAIETPRQVADKMAEDLKGWPGLKGEEQAISGRQQAAAGIASALNSAITRMRPWMHEKAEITNGNTEVSGSYRSGLPKEGESSVGEYAYRDMVDEEIANFKKVFEPLLRPYQSSVKKVQYYDGEKSWIYTTVRLK